MKQSTKKMFVKYWFFFSCRALVTELVIDTLSTFHHLITTAKTSKSKNK